MLGSPIFGNSHLAQEIFGLGPGQVLGSEDWKVNLCTVRTGYPF